MIAKHTNRGLTWVDVESPTQEEIRDLAKEYDLNPLVAHELSSPSVKPKVDLYKDFVYLILHFPRFRRDRTSEQSQEIDFVVGKKFLITVRYSGNDVLAIFSRLFEASAVLGKGDFGAHGGFVFSRMIERLYESVLNELSVGSDSMRSIEQKIFDGKERQMVVALSKLSRNLLETKRSLALHRDVLESFVVAGRMLFGETFAFQLQTLIGSYSRVGNALDSNLALLAELRETNNSLLDTKETETMRIITVIAFLTLPASVITNFFQMSTVHTPLVGGSFDWVIIVSFTLLGTAFLFLLAKRKQWF